MLTFRAFNKRLNRLAASLDAIRNRVAAHYSGNPQQQAERVEILRKLVTEGLTFELIQGATTFESDFYAAHLFQDEQIRPHIEAGFKPTDLALADELLKKYSKEEAFMRLKLQEISALQVELSEIGNWSIAAIAKAAGIGGVGIEDLERCWPGGYQSGRTADPGMS